MSEQAIRKQARALASERRTIEEHKANVAALHDKLMRENQDYQALVAIQEGIAEHKQREEAEKSALAELLVAEFKATGEKKYAGVGDVAIRKTVEYDPVEAVRFCIGSGMHGLLTVTSKFGKVAEGLVDVHPWVTQKEEPFARVSSKLEV